MAEHRNDTRFKWTVVAVAGLIALAMILGTVMEVLK